MKCYGCLKEFPAIGHLIPTFAAEEDEPVYLCSKCYDRWTLIDK